MRQMQTTDLQIIRPICKQRAFRRLVDLRKLCMKLLQLRLDPMLQKMPRVELHSIELLAEKLELVASTRLLL